MCCGWVGGGGRTFVFRFVTLFRFGAVVVVRSTQSWTLAGQDEIPSSLVVEVLLELRGISDRNF